MRKQMRKWIVAMIVGAMALTMSSCGGGGGSSATFGTDSAAGANTVVVAAVCGNSAVETGEICDDGNTTDGDGCSATCGAEATGVTTASSYVIVDTGQTVCYGDSVSMACPAAGASYHGQDAQYSGAQPSYTDNGDGTVTDNNTGLMWQQDPGAKMTLSAATAGASAFRLAGYSDWRMPTIKELYSLIQFNGTDPSGYSGTSTSGLVPFIDTNYFAFEYGDTSAGERIIDSQFASSNMYVGHGFDAETAFGVNFADGRIKGYGATIFGQQKTFFVLYVRGATNYGVNSFADNGDATITDAATGLMWEQADSGRGMAWADALSTCEARTTAGYTDWRLPSAKELQSIVDYTQAPSLGSAAIDPLFSATSFTNEGGQTDWGYYWSSTSHANYLGGSSGAYVAFGRGLGYIGGAWNDVHGAGCQRSDPKSGDPSDYPTGHGPQGDAIRIYNYVRCVRN